MKQTAILLGCVLASLFGSGQAVAAAPDSAKERELIALLKSGANAGEKAVAFKRLAIYGSADAVPVLLNEGAQAAMMRLHTRDGAAPPN